MFWKIPEPSSASTDDSLALVVYSSALYKHYMFCTGVSERRGLSRPYLYSVGVGLRWLYLGLPPGIDAAVSFLCTGGFVGGWFPVTWGMSPGSASSSTPCRAVLLHLWLSSFPCLFPLSSLSWWREQSIQLALNLSTLEQFTRWIACIKRYTSVLQ